MDKRSIDRWLTEAKSLVEVIEALLNEAKIPLIRGRLRDDGITVIDVDDVDELRIGITNAGASLGVLEYQVPKSPLDDESELEDLQIWLRLGQSDTWLHLTLPAPEDDSEDEQDGSGWPFSTPTLSIDDKTLQALAIRVARAPGFGSLRNRGERQDFADAILKESEARDLGRFDLHEIARSAETYFTLGVAPSLAKSLEREGKSAAEIAKALGISRVRAERALSTTTPSYITKLLSQ